MATPEATHPLTLLSRAPRRNRRRRWLDLHLSSDDARAVYQALTGMLDDPATPAGARMGLTGLACQLHNSLSRQL